jgi:hypothetical protein
LRPLTVKIRKTFMFSGEGKRKVFCHGSFILILRKLLRTGIAVARIK